MNRGHDERKGRNRDAAFDLDVLLHPARAYSQPDDVVRDPDLTLYEKRAILSSWAPDACAVEAAPGLREIPGNGGVVSFDEVMDALPSLDDEFHSRTRGVVRPKRRPITERLAARWRSRSGDGGLGSPQPAR
ncbi:MAG: hypothetical protein RO009_06180 [Pseudorhodoplanes sp.]|jgi:hypothetical protein|nr:hypothetical protein [Pseudorhodoplanes sp.]